MTQPTSAQSQAGGNTHRAAIECSVPPGLLLIASGPEDYCRSVLADWVDQNLLMEYERPVLLVVVPDGT